MLDISRTLARTVSRAILDALLPPKYSVALRSRRAYHYATHTRLNGLSQAYLIAPCHTAPFPP